MNLREFEIISPNSAGMEGASYLARHKTTQKMFEIRILRKSNISEAYWKRLSKRLLLHTVIEHKNILPVKESKLRYDPPYVIIEWLETRKLASYKNRLMDSKEQILRIFRETISALKHAHHMGLVHGNLSPFEIYLNPQQQVILDFLNFSVQPPNFAEQNQKALFQAPEQAKQIPDLAADIYSLAKVVLWFLGADLHSQHYPFSSLQELMKNSCWEARLQKPLAQLLITMLANEPTERPTAEMIQQQLEKMLASPNKEDPEKFSSGEASEKLPKAIGRFRILDLLGRGGMGVVYKAQDVSDDTLVAIKVLSMRFPPHEQAIKRFRKEARMMGELNNPYMVNLIEINQEQGLYYLVLEFIAGKNLGEVLFEKKKLSEKEAIAIMIDVARALLTAHDRGIVHRDIKPDNILLLDSSQVSTAHRKFPVKLSDFGLARHTIEKESVALTQPGTIMGTPIYMSPEQCSEVPHLTPASDIYSMGATFFHLLASRPPFVGETLLSLINMHHHKKAPKVRDLDPKLSEGIERVVEKCLQKKPQERYPNARAFLHDLETLLHGKPAPLIAPVPTQGKQKNSLRFVIEVQLKSSPQELWPYVANTERFNKAIGLAPVEYRNRFDPEKGLLRYGTTRIGGLLSEWREHPFEWLEGQKFGVLREYQKGPLKWFTSVVTLEKNQEGTKLQHTLIMRARNALAQLASLMEINLKSKKNIEKVYLRIDQTLQKRESQGNVLQDPFENPPSLSEAQEKKLQTLIAKLQTMDVDPQVARLLQEYLQVASDQEVARLRPLKWARKFHVLPAKAIEAFLVGAKIGLFNLLWDIICPICRVPSELQDTLQSLKSHGHCQACNLDFELDFHESIEMIFRVHPEIRPCELAVYCIGSPAHLPHVIAQIRVAPRARVEVPLHLGEGKYKIWSQQLKGQSMFWVSSHASLDFLELHLSKNLPPEEDLSLAEGQQTIAWINDTQHEKVMRIERTADRKEALTAKVVSSMPIFKELFPEEILSPGNLVSISTVTFLLVQLDNPESLYQNTPDSKAFQKIYSYLNQVSEEIKKGGGNIVKTIDEGILATYEDSVQAVATALTLQNLLQQQPLTKELLLKIVIHKGGAVLATLNDQLDYFGATLKGTWQISEHCPGGHLMLTHEVASHPQVSGILQEYRDRDCDIFQVDLLNLPGSFVLRIPLLKK